MPNTSTDAYDFKEYWFDNVLVNEGYKDYFMFNPTTEIGRDKIAKFNNVMEFWKEKTEGANFATSPSCSQNYMLLALIAKHGKRSRFLSPREGVHRATVSICALNGSVVNMTQPIIGVGDLTFKYYVDMNQIDS